MSGVTDPIADMLTRIRNAGAEGHPTALIPASNLKVAIARVLKEEGFIRDFDLLRGQSHRMLRVHLLYGERKEHVVRGLKRVSRPGLRKYVEKGEIPRLYGGLGVTILSTSQGVMSGDQARQRGIGGEVLCSAW